MRRGLPPLLGAGLLGGALLGAALPPQHGCAAADTASQAFADIADGAALPPGWAPAPVAVRPATRARVLREAGRALARRPRPLAHLASAGVADPDDPALLLTRAAFQDADDARFLALAWRLTGETRYADGATGRLVAWARTHVPTGHPIDETRLDALVDAWILARPAMRPADDEAVRAWLTTMRDRKRAWRFGPRTARNNHHTRQLASLLLLDRALDDAGGLATDRAAAEAHAVDNLDAETGESVDLRERDALRYHVYNLDAWLEIALATGCCDAPVTAAWRLVEGRLRSGETGGEFEGSVAPIDAARGRAGFGYGAPGSTFDPKRAIGAALAFHTLHPDPGFEPPAAADVERRLVYLLARYESWTR